MPFLTAHDHRGRTVPIIGPGWRVLWPFNRDENPDDPEAARLRAENAARPAIRRLVYGWVSSNCSSRHGSSTALTDKPLKVLVAEIRKCIQYMVAAALRAKCCPSCGYSLASSPEDSLRLPHVLRMWRGMAAHTRGEYGRTEASSVMKWKRSLQALVLLVILGEAANVASVFVHEVIGHGLTALALGGTFHGFTATWDGFGSADASLVSGAPVWHWVVMLAGGAVSTTVVGAALLAWSARFRGRPVAELCLLIFAGGFLLEGLPYMFWNSVYAISPGDFGQIWLMTRSVWLRAGWIILGGVGLLASTPYFMIRAARAIQIVCGGPESCDGFAIVIIWLFLGFGGFVFDWDLIAPGLGHLPNVVNLLFVSAITLVQFITTRRKHAPS